MNELTRQAIAKAQSALFEGNLALADIICRTVQQESGNSPEVLIILALIANKLMRNDFACHYAELALQLQPDCAPALEVQRRLKLIAPRPLASQPSYLLIKSWGMGFWSSIDHVLGQLLLCEMVGRIPVIHWGPYCLYGGSAQYSSFTRFFLPVSACTINDLLKQPEPYYPPKWTASNLRREGISRWEGPYSRISALYFLARPETVVVSDFHTAVPHLLPWIPPSHPLAGKTSYELYRHLVRTYLKPQPQIMNEVEAFYQQNLAGSPTIAVHVRGSDKITEAAYLKDINAYYDQCLAEELRREPHTRIFLLTDDQNIERQYRERFGDQLITTSAKRTSSEHGVHCLPTSDPFQLGKDVMEDTYLAARCDRFIGNGHSNVSAFVPFLKDWLPDTCFLIGPSLLLNAGPGLYQR